jgi:hypothetical protein
MKKWLYFFGLAWFSLTSCKDDEIALFDKTADERAAEAIATLKQDLVAPANGWRVKYRPESESGSFYLLMDFNENNTVTIKSDLGFNDGEFFEQTVTYRIDNSLGLELIIESYSFFSFLFEQGDATYLAEYEFNFVNKTPDDALVFNSKTDPDTPTILLFEEADAGDEDLLAQPLSSNLNIIAEDFEKWSSSLKITYQNKDLVLYIVVDNFRRTVGFNSAARKTNLAVTQGMNFTSPFVLKGDSIVFDDAFSGNVLGNNITIKGIKLSTLTEGTINICADPTTVHSYAGITSANDLVALETTIQDASGGTFAQVSDFFNGPLGYITTNGEFIGNQIAEDVTGAQAMQLYYNYNLGGGNVLYGIGFYLANANGEPTFALREFTPTLTGNNLVFQFAPEITAFGNPNPDADINNINIYLNALTEGDNTYVFKINDNVFELYNPCTGFSTVLFNGNQ